MRALRHVRVLLAAKAALAASGSWLIALQLPAPAPDYAFYAPLGAVVALYPTVHTSVAQAVRAVAAIALGASLALAASALWAATTGVVAVVVGIGVLLGGIPWLAEQRSYVPIAGLFVLVIGQGHELRYSAVYAGLFLIGAVVTVVVNAALPALLLREADDALDRLRDVVVAHLTYLADRLRDPGEEPLEDRGPGRPPLTAPTSTARRAVRQSREARRGNLRARAARDAVPHRYERFRTLERAVLTVEDLYQLLGDDPAGGELRRISPGARRPAATALDALARELRSDAAPHAARGPADEAVAALTAELADGRPNDEETLVMSALVVSLRRARATSSAPGSTP